METPTWLGPAIIAGGSLVGDAIGYQGQQSSNATNEREAQRQREFQERMSNTAHQREVEDYKKAGLNPALAYDRGGASTPPGAMSVAQNAGANFKNSAAAIASVVNEIANGEAQRDVARAQATNIDTQTNDINLNQSAKLQLLLEQASKTKTDATATREMLPYQKFNMHSGTLKNESEIDRNRIDNAFNLVSWQDRLRQLDSSITLNTSNAAESSSRRLLNELGSSKAKAESEYYRGIGKYSPYVSGAKDLFSIPKSLFTTLK